MRERGKPEPAKVPSIVPPELRRLASSGAEPRVGHLDPKLRALVAVVLDATEKNREQPPAGASQQALAAGASMEELALVFRIVLGATMLKATHAAALLQGEAHRLGKLSSRERAISAPEFRRLERFSLWNEDWNALDLLPKGWAEAIPHNEQEVSLSGVMTAREIELLRIAALFAAEDPVCLGTHISAAFTLGATGDEIGEVLGLCAQRRLSTCCDQLDRISQLALPKKARSPRANAATPIGMEQRT